MGRVRLDALLVDRGLVRNRSEAVQMIDAGRVLVNGSVAQKAARQVNTSESVHVASPPARFVSRGGLKLDRALHVFGIDPTDRTAVDAGSATGGFTDCLLQAGAIAVVAVDVGYGQLHERLRVDQRVISLERTNIRDVDRERATSLLAPRPAPSLVVADLSFMSARRICARLLEVSGEKGETVILCKPQFEASHEAASRGRGVIRERSERSAALKGVTAAIGECGATVKGVTCSPILGPAGNAEFLVHASHGNVVDEGTVGVMIDAALDEAETL